MPLTKKIAKNRKILLVILAFITDPNGVDSNRMQRKVGGHLNVWDGYFV